MKNVSKYVLNFPDPNFNYTLQNGDFTFDVTKEKIPVVLLFGWTGSQDKHLAKYSKIYEDKGLITLRVTTSVVDIFFRKMQMAARGENIINLVADMKLDKNPVLVHCFSNGGYYMYQNFIIALDKSSKPLDIQGVVFDSGPGELSRPLLYELFSTLIGGKPPYNVVMASALTTAVVFLRQCETSFSNIFPTKVPPFNPLKTLQSEKNIWPQHFIYSKKDRLIPHSDVTYFANYRKSIGVPVTSTVYENSSHVEHYLRNKESYVNSVYTFVNKCLRRLKK